MRIVILTAATLFCVVPSVSVNSQAPADPLEQFRGLYQIANGGSVRVTGALGGSYTEWSVQFGKPSHELRMFVGARASNGTFRVWRFEQEPAPAVTNEGVARLDGQELVAEFPHVDGPTGKRIRERWRLTNTGLEFALEASGDGGEPRRVGGFAATRQ